MSHGGRPILRRVAVEPIAHAGERARPGSTARAVMVATASPEAAKPFRFSFSTLLGRHELVAHAVAEHEPGGHRRALGGRHDPAPVRSSRSVERPAVHDVPRARSDPPIRRGVRVVVVVAGAEGEMRDLVRDGAGVLSLPDRRQSPLHLPGFPASSRARSASPPIAASTYRGCPTRRGCPPSTRTSSRRTPATRSSRRSRRRSAGRCRTST